MHETIEIIGTIETGDLGEVGADHAHTWFEACVEHRGAATDGPCDDCGWLAADHNAGLAVVIEVGRTSAVALRRAS